MLTIGKVGVAQAEYYERTVADGAEEYYTGRGEERGEFVGTGADELGLSGRLDDGDLPALLDGRHPNSGDAWVQRRPPPRSRGPVQLASGELVSPPAPVATAAFDLTFSAPKSVSVLWAITDEAVSVRVKEAHLEAVRQSFDYLERVACVTRRGHAGARQLRGDGFVGAAFNHRTSREGDPQLHTHVLVSNGTSADGRHTALHGAALYREAKTAGYLYQAVLRRELTRQLGVEWERIVNGHAEIAGVDPKLCEMFSKRSQQIAEALERVGESGPRAAQVAALSTRAVKAGSPVADRPLRELWRDEAREIGLAAELRGVVYRTVFEERSMPDDETLNRFAARAFGPNGLTKSRTTFGRRDVIQYVAQRAHVGASVEQLEQIADRLLEPGRGAVIRLEPDAAAIPGGVALRADGEVIANHGADLAFTTAELVACERSIIDSVARRQNEGAAAIDPSRVRDVIADRARDVALDVQQAAMVESLTTSGAGVEAVVGLGGSGKTYSLRVAHDAWDEYGIEVRGCAIAKNAADVLEDATGIRSQTIASVLRDLDDADARERALPIGGVLVVDEAGMLPTRDLARILEAAEQAETKVVLVGDHRQLPEIEAGGSFAAVVHRFDALQLDTNRRQVERWEQEALREMRAGSVDRAIEAYVRHDRITAHAEPEVLRQQLARDWAQAFENDRTATMIALERRQVDELNKVAREILRDRGELSGNTSRFAGKDMQVGERVVCTTNNKHLDVTNGMRGTITDIDRQHKRIQMETDRGRIVNLPFDYAYNGNLEHAYAITGHKAQGMTVNQAFVLASPNMYREWTYVAMSRAREHTQLYVDTISHDPSTGHELSEGVQLAAGAREVTRNAERSRAQATAMDLSRSNPDVLSLREVQRPEWAQRQRGDAQLARQLADKPPEHLRSVLGDVPIEPDDRQRWGRDALATERYRTHQGLDPAQMTSRLAGRVAHVAHGFTRAAQLIAIDERELELQRQRERQRERGFGLEIEPPGF